MNKLFAVLMTIAISATAAVALADGNALHKYGRNDPVDMRGAKVYDSKGPLNAGAVGNSNHTLATGDVLVPGKFEAQGAGYFEGSLTVGGTLSPAAVGITGANGAAMTWGYTRASTTLSSGSTANAVAITAGSCVLGVVARVTTTITGCSTIQIGDGTTADRWGTGIALTATTTTTGTAFKAATAPICYPSAGNVVITCTSGGGSFTAGVIETEIFFSTFTAPTT